MAYFLSNSRIVELYYTFTTQYNRSNTHINLVYMIQYSNLSRKVLTESGAASPLRRAPGATVFRACTKTSHTYEFFVSRSYICQQCLPL